MGMAQRKVANYVKMAGLSKGYYLHVFAGGVAFLGILMAYASRLLQSDRVDVGYATIFPSMTIVKVVAAQIAIALYAAVPS